MSPAWIGAALLVPLAGALLAMVPGVPRGALRLAQAIFALPALAVALWLPAGTTLSAPALFLGVDLALAGHARTFLGFTALLWTLAGIYSAFYAADDARLRSYTVFLLTSFTGNAGLLFATDIPMFYTSFALMTFAAYGLVVHSRGADALRAGRLYIGMAVFGELLVLSGLLWLAHENGSIRIDGAAAAVAASPNAPWILGLLLFGFGVKAGLLPVHVWLPLAHPVAPTPASAVLSGSMIKAGLYGWLVFLPGGAIAWPGWGTACIVLGLAAAFGAAYAGFTQNNAKANLAYSSISQMGVMTMVLGIGLSGASAWDKAAGLLAFYAFNHALAKGALFLAVGAAHAARTRRAMGLVLAGAAAASLALAGGPFTGGELAKGAVKKFLAAAPDGWAGALGLLMLASSFATTVLLGRYVYLVARSMRDHADDHAHAPANRGVLAAWGLSVAACLAVPWWAAGFFDTPVAAKFDVFGSLLKAWPVALGIAAAWWAAPRAGAAPGVPAGDLGLAVLRVSAALARWWTASVAPRMERSPVSTAAILRLLVPEEDEPRAWPDRADLRIRSLTVAGALALALLAVLWWSVGT